MKKFLIMLVVLIGSFVNLYTMGKKAEENIVHENDNKVSYIQIEENIIEEQEEIVEDIVQVKQDEIIKQENKEVKENKDNITTKKNENNSTKNEKSEQKDKVESIPNTDIVKQEEVVIKQEDKKENLSNEEDVIISNLPKIEEMKQEEIVEEYKINYEMINKIKSIIENNPTEDMKTYGYEIVVDSSIPELTNEFTFTNQRVLDKIVWKFGTIRIYARDYYFNGNYVSTQCFIV